MTVLVAELAVVREVRPRLVGSDGRVDHAERTYRVVVLALLEEHNARAVLEVTASDTPGHPCVVGELGELVDSALSGEQARQVARALVRVRRVQCWQERKRVRRALLLHELAACAVASHDAVRVLAFAGEICEHAVQSHLAFSFLCVCLV